jgi:hypothetical protein
MRFLYHHRELCMTMGGCSVIRLAHKKKGPKTALNESDLYTRRGQTNLRCTGSTGDACPNKHYTIKVASI